MLCFFQFTGYQCLEEVTVPLRSLPMALEVQLVSFILNHCLQIIGAVSTMTLLYVSWKTRLLKRKSLLLFHSLVLFDCIHFITGLPYTAFLISGWNPIRLDYHPWIMLTIASPIMLHLKLNLLILVGIASDRFLAVFCPRVYYNMNHRKYAYFFGISAVTIGIFDYILMWIMSPVERTPTCPAVVCFTSEKFRLIWGITNGFLGAVVFILTCCIMCRLRTLSSSREDRKFSQANRIALVSLVSSVLIIIPSIYTGFFPKATQSLWETIGPFYLTLTLTSEVTNTVTQLFLNTELRTGLIRILKRHQVQVIPSTS